MTSSAESLESLERQRRKDLLVKKRYAAERRFVWYGRLAVMFGVSCLLLLFSTIFSKGYTAFVRTTIRIPVTFSAEDLDVSANPTQAQLEAANYYGLVKKSIYNLFPEVSARKQKKELGKLLSSGASLQLRDLLLSSPELLGRTLELELIASSDLDQIVKGNAPVDIEESKRVVSDFQLQILSTLREEGRVGSEVNFSFFTRGDSRSAELAGIGGALTGSILTLLVCFFLSFPIGVAAAVYLEEFAPKNRWTEIIEININNLAAVPSIVFGLLGLGIILNVFGLPRGTPLVGGVVLALMTLPTIIIACRASLKAVPPSIRQAALGMGASPVQVVLHHVLPLALPGTMTGTIIGLAQALGETAPLLMIGMVAFVVDVPGGIEDTATALPVQIYLWAESAERGFVEKTSAAIMVILMFLMLMNATAVYFRSKFERRW